MDPGATCRKRIRDGESWSSGATVLGQQPAVTKTLDILKRVGHGPLRRAGARGSSRPRGVLFFAGPTGVGKTELAKALTELVFGDETAYLRFDMSEFSAEHADDRLIGAPPGYVGYDAGGELTNAVRAAAVQPGAVRRDREGASRGSSTSSCRSSRTAGSPTGAATHGPLLRG